MADEVWCRGGAAGVGLRIAAGRTVPGGPLSGTKQQQAEHYYRGLFGRQRLRSDARAVR